MPQAKPRNPITLRQGQNIGQPAAEDDDAFLFATFLDNYAYNSLCDLSSPKFLLVGRTGTGKTAILRKIEERFDRVIRIDPQELSLQYISNSDIIAFFQRNGVKLDLFYQLLWRHVIATELIKRHFCLDDEQRTKQFFRQISNLFNSKRKRALEYMQSFGSDFWLETDARITQVTSKFESELKAAVGVNYAPLKADLNSTTGFSEEQKQEIIYRAQQVVDKVHIQQLSEVIDWLYETIDDHLAPYYIIIDDLDLPFSGGNTRLLLIIALIETCKKFRKVKNAKIVMALRTDLIQRVFESTRDDGFQEEKYRGNIVELEWSSGELKELVDRRIRESIRRQYTGSKLGFSDVFPDRVNQSDSFSYMVQRTLHRPRDIIVFVNDCLEKAVGADRVTLSALRKAEEFYSDERFNALRDEWRGQYPLLEIHCRPLIGKPRRFPYNQIATSDIDDLILRLATELNADSDRLGHIAISLGTYGGTKTIDFIIEWLDALYKIGALGVKTSTGTTVKWNYRGLQSLNRGDVTSDSMIYIHPMLWRRLGVLTKDIEPD
jgi:hypothetical protein